jgi:RHS repeat-associated protein
MATLEAGPSAVVAGCVNAITGAFFESCTPLFIPGVVPLSSYCCKREINPWKFSSKRFDPETGFIYFGRRYYDPEIGRLITPDPAGFADGPNLYAYLYS